MLMDPSIESLDLSGKGFRKLDIVSENSQQKILSLKLDNNHMTSLQGIHQYPNLLQFSARANRISDISPLGQLTQLVIVNVQNNAISIIQGIDSLSCLQWISLSGNTIKDASGIESCVHLTHLDLSDNFIRVLPDLSKLTLLKTLLLHGNGIRTLSSSSPFPSSLHTLTLAENSLTDLNEFSVLHSIKSLRQLSLMGNPCTNETTHDGRLVEYRLFVLYWRPSLSVIDGVTTTDVERHQARMLFFGHQQCPFSIGDHENLIQHLSWSSFNKPFDSYSVNNENSSPNLSPTKGPRLFKSTQDPVISSTRRRLPLSPNRMSIESTTTKTSSIIETLNSLKEVQRLIKEEEQFLLDQSVATVTTSIKENDDDTEVGVALASSMIIEDTDDHSSYYIPESKKGFGDSTTSSERGVVRIGPRLRYSPIPMNEIREEESITREEYHNESSLASSMTKAYGIPLPDCTSLTQGLAGSTSHSLIVDDEKGLIQDHTDSVQFHPPSAQPDSVQFHPPGALPDSVQFHPPGALPDSVQFHPPGAQPDSVQFHPPGAQPELVQFHPPGVHSHIAESVQLQITKVHSHTADSVQFLSPYVHSDATDSVQLHSPEVHSQNTDSVQFNPSDLHSRITDSNSDSYTTDSVQFQGPIQTDHTPHNVIDNSSLVPPLQLEAINTGAFPRESEIGYIHPSGDDIDHIHPNHTQPPIANPVVHTYSPLTNTDHTHSPGDDTDHTHSQSKLSVTTAAIIIQNTWRGYICRQLLWKHKAAVKIQAAWRGYHCRVYCTEVGNVYREMRRKKVESYITLLYMQMEGCREELAHQILTVQIQEEALKTLLTEVEEIRNELKIEKEIKRRKAATVIQKYWRGYLTRKQHKIVKKSLKNEISHPPLQDQVNNLELAVYNLTSLLVRQIDLPAPLNLHMTHFSSSCLLVQWDPPPDTPLCTHPLINRPDIIGYTLYINGEKEGMVTSMKCKAYIEGLDCSITYKIVVKAVYDQERESLPSNPVVATLSQPSPQSPDNSTIDRVTEYPEFPKANYRSIKGNDHTQPDPTQDSGNVPPDQLRELTKINTTYDLNKGQEDSDKSSTPQATPVLVDTSISVPPPPLTSVKKTTKFFQDPTISLIPPILGNTITTEGVGHHLTSSDDPLPPVHVAMATDGNTHVSMTTDGVAMTMPTLLHGAQTTNNKLTSHSSLPSLKEFPSFSITKRHSCSELYQKSFYRSVSSHYDLVMNKEHPQQYQPSSATDTGSDIYKKSFYNSLEYHALI